MTEMPEYSPAFRPSAPEGDNDSWWTKLYLVVIHRLAATAVVV